MNQNNENTIREAVKNQYRKIAEISGLTCGCNTTGCCNAPNKLAQEQLIHLSNTMGYSKDDLISAPEGSNLALGCGNPQAIASLNEGDSVLDLGSGGGFDCFLAARKVGPTGKVLGIDMTPEMIKKATENARKGQYHQVKFQLAEIEHLPIPNACFDVIISNCVINLSTNKPQVFREIFRVLRPGGRLAISDVVATSVLPEPVRNDLNMISACIAGVTPINHLKKILSTIGFKEIQILTHANTEEIIHDWAPGLNPEKYTQSASISAIKSLQ